MISKKRKKPVYSKNTRQIKELVREVRYLRSVARDVIDRYSLKIHAHLVNVVRILESPDGKRQLVKKPSGNIVHEMLLCVRSLKVKPKKGRAKDLARIEVIAKKLEDLIP